MLPAKLSKLTQAQLRACRINEVKRDCERRIVAAGWPLYKQINSLRAGGDGGGTVIDALRERSNSIEEQLSTLDHKALLSFNVRDDAHWRA